MTDYEIITTIMGKMPKLPLFRLVYDPEVKRHLQAIDVRHYSQIRRTIEEQLSYEPFLETRNRKPLKRPVAFEADWELRFGPDNCFRVFYAIDSVAREVCVLAIGTKEGNRLKIGGEEVKL